MKISILKIILISLISFIILVFFLALNIEKKYSTEKLIGKKIDNFEIKYLFEEDVFNQNDLINEQYYLINIWASWC